MTERYYVQIFSCTHRQLGCYLVSCLCALESRGKMLFNALKASTHKFCKEKGVTNKYLN